MYQPQKSQIAQEKEKVPSKTCRKVKKRGGKLELSAMLYQCIKNSCKHSTNKEKQILRARENNGDENIINHVTATNISAAFKDKQKTDDDCDTVVENDCDNDYSLLFNSVERKY